MKAAQAERSEALCLGCRKPWSAHLTKRGALLKKYQKQESTHKPSSGQLMLDALLQTAMDKK